MKMLQAGFIVLGLTGWIIAGAFAMQESFHEVGGRDDRGSWHATTVAPNVKAGQMGSRLGTLAMCAQFGQGGLAEAERTSLTPWSAGINSPFGVFFNLKPAHQSV